MMSKEKRFIAYILQSIFTCRDEKMFSVVSWPIKEKLLGEYHVRVVVTWYNKQKGDFVRVLDMPMTGLELKWCVQCLQHVGLDYLAGEFQDRLDKHFEMEHTRVIIRKSVKEWQSR